MEIKELRTKTGKSQKEFANAFNIPVRTLQKWEIGQATPPEYIPQMIERILEYEFDIYNKITKEEYIYNMLRLEQIPVKREHMPMIMKRRTVYELDIPGMIKTDNILKAAAFVLNDTNDFDIDLVCRINRIIDYGRDDEKEGMIRDVPVSISGTSYRPGIPDIDSVKEMIVSVSKNNDEIDRALSMMLYLMKTQLFRDGNKRTAQLASAALLKNTDYVISIPFVKQKLFLKMLVEYYENDDDRQVKEFIRKEALFRRSDF